MQNRKYTIYLKINSYVAISNQYRLKKKVKTLSKLMKIYQHTLYPNYTNKIM